MQTINTHFLISHSGYGSENKWALMKNQSISLSEPLAQVCNYSGVIIVTSH